LALLSKPEGHYEVKLDIRALERFTVWMDTYAQRLGSFSADQERRLEDLRRACANLLTEPAAPVSKTPDLASPDLPRTVLAAGRRDR
jgi:hypothetical protein